MGQHLKQWSIIKPTLDQRSVFAESISLRRRAGAFSTAAFHARVRGSFPGGLKETKMFLPHPLVKLSIVESLRERVVACSASDLQGLGLILHDFEQM